MNEEQAGIVVGFPTIISDIKLFGYDVSIMILSFFLFKLCSFLL